MWRNYWRMSEEKLSTKKWMHLGQKVRQAKNTTFASMHWEKKDKKSQSLNLNIILFISYFIYYFNDWQACNWISTAMKNIIMVLSIRRQKTKLPVFWDLICLNVHEEMIKTQTDPEMFQSFWKIKAKLVGSRTYTFNILCFTKYTSI